MPRKNTDLTKTERVQLILDLFNAHHFMNKELVDRSLAALTGIDINDLKQSTYRDLNWLVEKGRLKVRHVLPDGTMVNDGEQGDEKTFRSEWYLPTTKDFYVGAGLIADSEANLYFSKRLEGKFSLNKIQANQIALPNHFNIEGRLGKQLLCLSVHRDALPFKLIIGRLKDDQTNDSENFFSEVEDSFGQRCIYLDLPSMDLSSYKDRTRAGNTCVEFLTSGKVIVKDLNSTNHTFVEQDLSTRTIARIKGSRNFTSENYPSYGAKDDPSTVLAPPDGLDTQLPARVNCAGRINLLIYET